MERSPWIAAHQSRTAQAIHGLVCAVDPENHAVKVRVQPDDTETGWLPDAAVTQVGDLRLSCPLALGSHVLLMPVEGDGEHYVVIAVLYDIVAGPPQSPYSGKVATSGELLIRAGCGRPSGSRKDAEDHAGWLHLNREGVFFGAGEARCLISHSSCEFHVGDVKLVLDSKGLSVLGGDVRTDAHSLASHVHPYDKGMTGKAVG